MIRKLQRKTLPGLQIAAYLFTLLIGTVIILSTVQFYADIKPLILEQSDVFKGNAVILSKTITQSGRSGKANLYFSEEEMNELRAQEFIRETARFHTAGFEISAYIGIPGSGQTFGTDLFFESVPDKYLDILPEDWKWEPESNFVPVIIPRAYLNLYNFGFAESQNLPVVSQDMVSLVGFNLVVSGNFKRQVFQSRIVGLSDKINSILVPEDFLLWANQEYARNYEERSSRLLVEFADPADARIPQYLKEKGYSINKDELEFSKIVFIFQAALLFLGFVAVVIIFLSSGFILLSMNLITQKNRELILNLYNIGYSSSRIARFYQVVVSLITALAVGVSMILATIIRSAYIKQFGNVFEVVDATVLIVPVGTILLLLLFVLYNLLLRRSINRITHNK
ncbi:hypothetical protein LJB91_00830 [Bacteroidales bacterium OttesenSCG-928-L03]|nr:hypothetical protein [Bacteroidales bacterium OttesenSCG-928-L03]